jgi:glutamate/tyrosine decarboxylase-like PLP-dependent enzyme
MSDPIARRDAPLEMSPEEFRRLGHAVVDEIAEFLRSLPQRPVTPAETPREIRAALGGGGLPEEGAPADALLQEASRLVFDHSLFNGHPRFWGYITSSAAPIGALADLLASAANANVGGWELSPMASEIELQTIRWIAELIGYPAGCGGLLVSGGNVANLVGFAAARRARATWDIRNAGLAAGPRMAVYASRESHTWIQKAADLFGLGLNAIRWVPVDASRRMDVSALEAAIVSDEAAGLLPMMAVGAAGTVGVGAVDPLPAIAEVCRRHGLWFHVDGAYGAPAAVLPEASADLRGLSLADSVAVDPHKWLYAPIEAGATLVRDPKTLFYAFSFHPEYYTFSGLEDEDSVNFYEIGFQNSRGFRALKVWLAFRQIGRQGYIRLIRDDIALAEALHAEVAVTSALQAFTRNLSIATFRYVPPDRSHDEPYLNALNEEILTRIKSGGEAFVSNAVLDGAFVLRACIVNFRTTLADVLALPDLVVRVGRDADRDLRESGR